MHYKPNSSLVPWSPLLSLVHPAVHPPAYPWPPGVCVCVCRTTSLGVVVTQIRQIGDKLQRKRQAKQEHQQEHQEQDQQEQDFDIEAVCQLLNQPREVISSSSIRSAAVIGRCIDTYISSGSSRCAGVIGRQSIYIPKEVNAW